MIQSDFKNNIKQKLVKQGYPEKAADMVSHDLTEVDRALKSLVEKWLKGEERDFQSHSYSIFRLMKSRGMTYPAALLTIDWLIKEPENAKKSLEKGIR